MTSFVNEPLLNATEAEAYIALVYGWSLLLQLRTVMQSCEHALAILRMKHIERSSSHPGEAADTQRDAILGCPAIAELLAPEEPPSQSKESREITNNCSFKPLGSLCSKSKLINMLSAKYCNNICKALYYLASMITLQMLASYFLF